MRAIANDDEPEYIYDLIIRRWSNELHRVYYKNLEDLLIGASAWLVDFAQSNGQKLEETE